MSVYGGFVVFQALNQSQTSNLMACLEMYNNSNPPHPHSQPSPPMSPRISFSNDFVESHHNSHQHLRSEPPASSDFEFSVSNYNMISADELFFKGRILPFSFKDKKKNTTSSKTLMQRTLRDELLADDDQDHDNIEFSVKPPKPSSSSNGWKGFLGLRKSHIGSKKPEKTDFSFDSTAKSFSFSPPQDPNTKSSQGVVSNEGPSGADMEVGI